MSEVKFLSYTGLQTLLNKLKENFVLKSDYVTTSSANFLQLKFDDIEHNSHIINQYESDPANTFLYMEMDGLCKIFDVLPHTTFDSATDTEPINYYELTSKVEILNSDDGSGMVLSIGININTTLFPDGTLLEPTMMYDYNKSSYCLDNLGDRYSIYMGLMVNLEFLYSKLELYLAEHEGSTEEEAFKALSYLITLPHVTKINIGGLVPFYTIVNFCLDPFGGFYFNESGNYIFSQYDLYSGFQQDIIIYEPGENSGSSVTEYTAGTGLTISGTTINHSNSVSPNTKPSLLKIQYDAQGHITVTSSITKSDIIGLGIPEYTAGDNITISNNKISAKDTTYSAGTNITISGTTISAKDTTYTAGDNITISGTQISAKDTIYTAGDNITISGTQISSIDTKNTAGSTNSSNKLYIIGAEEQSENPQTYSRDGVYIDEDGCIYSNDYKVLTTNDKIEYTKEHILVSAISELDARLKGLEDWRLNPILDSLLVRDLNVEESINGVINQDSKSSENTKEHILTTAISELDARVKGLEDWRLNPILDSLLVRDLNVEESINGVINQTSNSSENTKEHILVSAISELDARLKGLEDWRLNPILDSLLVRDLNVEESINGVINQTSNSSENTKEHILVSAISELDARLKGLEDWRLNPILDSLLVRDLNVEESINGVINQTSNSSDNSKEHILVSAISELDARVKGLEDWRLNPILDSLLVRDLNVEESINGVINQTSNSSENTKEHILVSAISELDARLKGLEDWRLNPIVDSLLVRDLNVEESINGVINQTSASSNNSKEHILVSAISELDARLKGLEDWRLNPILDSLLVRDLNVEESIVYCGNDNPVEDVDNLSERLDELYNIVESHVLTSGVELNELNNYISNHITDSNAHKDTTYTAGDNITIAGTTISAKDTTYDIVTNENPGLVPKLENNTNKFLRSDGGWYEIPNTPGGSTTASYTPGDNIKIIDNTIYSIGAGSTHSNKKLYLVGSDEQTDYAKTYSNSGVFVSSGCLFSNSSKVALESTLDNYTPLEEFNSHVTEFNEHKATYDENIVKINSYIDNLNSYHKQYICSNFPSVFEKNSTYYITSPISNFDLTDKIQNDIDDNNVYYLNINFRTASSFTPNSEGYTYRIPFGFTVYFPNGDFNMLENNKSYELSMIIYKRTIQYKLTQKSIRQYSAYEIKICQCTNCYAKGSNSIYNNSQLHLAISQTSNIIWNKDRVGNHTDNKIHIKYLGYENGQKTSDNTVKTADGFVNTIYEKTYSTVDEAKSSIADFISENGDVKVTIACCSNSSPHIIYCNAYTGEIDEQLSSSQIVENGILDNITIDFHWTQEICYVENTFTGEERWEQRQGVSSTTYIKGSKNLEPELYSSTNGNGSTIIVYDPVLNMKTYTITGSEGHKYKIIYK